MELVNLGKQFFLKKLTHEKDQMHVACYDKTVFDGCGCVTTGQGGRAFVRRCICSNATAMSPGRLQLEVSH